MGRINRKKVVFFICSFLGLLILLILTHKFAVRKGPNWSWEKIIERLPIIIICTLALAAWITWEKGDELMAFFFSRKKRKKAETKKSEP